MSYSIVYERQFLKANDGRIIPLILVGSNNVWSGNKRARDWSPMYCGTNHTIAITEAHFLDRVKLLIGGEYQQHFKRNGKWVDDAALLRFAHNGIRNAKTIEELNAESRIGISLHGGFSVWYYDGSTYKDGTRVSQHRNEHFGSIHSSAELDAFLASVDERLKNRLPDETIFVQLAFPSEKAVEYPLVRKRRVPKARLTDFYAIKVTPGDYFIKKLTAKTLQFGYTADAGKQFPTEKEATKWLEKYCVHTRFPKRQYSVVCEGQPALKSA